MEKEYTLKIKCQQINHQKFEGLKYISVWQLVKMFACATADNTNFEIFISN